MTLEELKQESYKDLPVKNVENIDQESFYNQEIKAKWLDYKSRFELLLARSKGDYQVLYREKWEYYGGKSDAKIYASKPFDFKVLKADLDKYFDADVDLIRCTAKIEYQQIMLEYLESILKVIQNRTYQIKNAIEWQRFTNGL